MLAGNARTATTAEAIIRPIGSVAAGVSDMPKPRDTAPGPTHDVDLDLEVVTTRAAFNALEAEWNALFDRAGRSIHVFQTFNWCWHWCAAFLTEDASKLFVVTARRQGRLVLILPLVREHSFGLTRLAFLGEPVTQYGDALVDVLADSASILATAWRFAIERSGADCVHLRRVRADANLAPLLAASGARISEKLAAPYLDLASAANFDAYEQRYSSKARKNRRRLLRRFEERAPATLETLLSGTRARELAELAILLKRAWLKDRGLVSPALTDPRTRTFFANVAEAKVRPAGCRVTSLETRGESTAIEIAFDCKGRRAVHVIVFALKYERASPGQLLIERSIRNCFDIGVGTYDLMTPADAYKLDWADGATEVNDWTLACTARGRIYADFYLARLRPQLKRAVNTATQRLRRLRGRRGNSDSATDGD